MSLNNKTMQIILANLLGIAIGYFFYKNSDLNEQQILIYIILWIFSISLLFSKNKFLRFLSLPGFLSITFFIVLGFLPLYKQTPDGSNFYLTQQTEYIFFGNPKNVEIKEISKYGEQKISPTENKQKILFIESPSRSIIFDEKTNNPKEDNKLIIKLPTNTIYIIYPGSKVTIQKKENKFIITKEYGKNEYYKPSYDIQTYIDNTNPQEEKNKSEFSLSYMIDDYEKLRTKYIIKQSGGAIIMQPIYQKFSKKILNLAYFIRPEIYSKNIQNYEAYKQFFERKEIETNYQQENEWRKLIIEQIQKGRTETRFLQ